MCFSHSPHPVSLEVPRNGTCDAPSDLGGERLGGRALAEVDVDVRVEDGDVHGEGGLELCLGGARCTRARRLGPWVLD